MDITYSRLATRQDRRDLRRLCRGWDRTRFDRMQATGLVLAALVIGYIPLLTGAVWLAHQ